MALLVEIANSSVSGVVTKIFFVSVLLTVAQLGPVSYLLFISVFGGWHHLLGQIGK